MSLKNQIANKASPVRMWMDSHVNDLSARVLAREINDQLSSSLPLATQGSDPKLAGTAFDLGFRWMLEPLEARAARAGARMCQSRFGWRSAEAIVDRIIEAGNMSEDPETRARCCVILSWFEWIYRSGKLTPELKPYVASTSSPRVIRRICDSAPSAVVEDVAMLLATVPGVWGDDLDRPFVLNPTFSGSLVVGGADADWIVEGAIYDCKCSGCRRPFGRRELLQGLGYVLLDAYNEYDIHSLGWYYARQRLRLIYSVSPLFNRLFDTDELENLRRDFWKGIAPVMAFPSVYTRYAGKYSKAHLSNALSSTPKFSEAFDEDMIRLQRIVHPACKELLVGSRRISLQDKNCVMISITSIDRRILLACVPEESVELRWALVKNFDPTEQLVRCTPEILTPENLLSNEMLNALLSKLIEDSRKKKAGRLAAMLGRAKQFWKGYS